MGGVTHGHHPGVSLADPAGVVLLLAHVVDDVLLLAFPGPAAAGLVHRADYVQLVVLPGQVACTKLSQNEDQPGN